MRTRIVLFSLLLAVALAPPAAAKGVALIAVCGADGCKDVTRVVGDNAPFPYGKAVRAPRTSAALVRIVVVIAEPQGNGGGSGDVVARQSYLYAPSLHLARSRTAPHHRHELVWQRVDALARQTLGRVVDGVARYPARPLDRVGALPEPHLPPIHPVGMNRSSGPIDGTPHYLTRPAKAKTSKSGFAWTWPAGVAVLVAAAGLAWRRRVSADRAT